MSTTEYVAEPDAKGVRDRADVRRQVKLVVSLGVIFLLLLKFATDIDNPTVTYLLAEKRTAEHQPQPFNGLRVVWITVVVVGILLALSAVNRFPKGWLGGVLLGIVGVSFYLGFVIWYFSDQPEGGLQFFIANPLPPTLNYATPLILGAMAGVLCERSGVINIAIEAQFLMGAFFGSVCAALAYSAGMGLLAASLAGIATAWLLGVFAIRYHVNQVVLGVVLIALALGLTRFLVGQIPSATENQHLYTILTDFEPLQNHAIPVLSDIPIIGAALFNQTILTYIAMVSVFVVWFLLYKTTWGLRVRAVGEHPKAADTVGIKVNRVRWQAILVGGAFAGLGGAFFTVGSSGTFNANASNGQGFMALAAVIMGRWHPVLATCAALFFGLMFTLGDQVKGLTKVPSELIAAAPYLATLIAVAGFIGRVRAPAANGEPYVKS